MKIKHWIQSLFARTSISNDREDHERQNLRLELAAHAAELETLRRSYRRLQTQGSEQVESRLRAKLARLMAEAAAPVAQLITQSHLVEAEGRELRARDVLMIARRLIRALEEEGLEIRGNVGERLAFDPNWHTPLDSRQDIAPGEEVTLRFPALSFDARVLQKAGVELPEDEST